MRSRGQFGEWSQSLQRQILLTINNSKLEEVDGKKGGQDCTEKTRRRGGGKGRRGERPEDTLVDIGRRLCFSVHLLNVAEIHHVAAKFLSLKGLQDV